MALVIADRVRETTTTTGTGAVTLAGAYTSFQSFLAAVGNGNSTYYTIASAVTGEWEVGIGTYTSASNTLSRTTVLASSNAGSLVNFSSGAKDVFVTQPAERSILVQSAGSGLFSGVAAFTANGVPYANSTSTLTTGSALTFDGTNLGIGAAMQSGYGRLQVRNGFAYVNEDGSNTYQLYLRSGFGGTLPAVQAVGGDLGFVLGSSEAMRLTSTGLGIGTSSPSGIGRALNVYGAAGDVSTVIAEGDAGNKFLALYSGSASNDNGAIYSNQSIRFGYATSKAAAGYTNLMTLDTSGNLGLGVTPSAWGTTNSVRAFQIGSAGSVWTYSTGNIYLGNNYYWDGSARKRINADVAGEFSINGNTFAWQQAATGTAGSTVTFTQAMTLDSSGNLGIGTSSPSFKQHTVVSGATGDIAGFGLTGNANNPILLIKADATNQVITFRGGSSTSTYPAIAFDTGTGGEKMRLDSSGNLGIGTSSPDVLGLGYGKVLGISSASSVGLEMNAAFGSTSNIDMAVNGTRRFQAEVENSAVTLKTRGAVPLLFGTDNTERMRLDSSGNLGIGTSSPNVKLEIYGGAATNTYSRINTAAGQEAGLQFADGGTLKWTIYKQGGGGNDLGWYSYATSSTVMVLNAAGNLGLQVTPPTATSGSYIWNRGGCSISDGPGQSYYVGVQNAVYNNGWKYVESGNAAQYIQTGSQHQWKTAPSGTAGDAITFTQVMTLDASGNLLVGTTSSTPGNNNGIIINPGTATTTFSHDTSQLSGYYYCGFTYGGNTYIGSIAQNGTTSVSYNTSSDYRLKDNPQPLTGSGAFIDALKPKTWNWKADGSRGVGFIAHEVQEVSPGSVVGEKDGEQMQAMEYGSAEFIANIIAELQSLRKRLADAGIA